MKKTLIPKNISRFKMVYYTFIYFGFMYKDNKPWSLIAITLLWFILNTFGITSIIEIFMGNDLFRAISALAIYTVTIIKLINFTFKEKEIRDILERLERLRADLVKDKENKKALEETSNNLRRILTIVAVLISSAPVLDFIRTTLEEYQMDFKRRSVYFSIWVPWNTEEVGPYLAKKCLAFTMAAVVVEVHLSFFFLQFIFAFQMSAYLKMLKKDLEVKGPADEGMYELHKSLLKLIKDYNEIFSGQMYYETVVAPLLPCGRGLLALRQIKTNGFIQLEVIPKILSALSPSFVVCSCGQKIITQVEELHEASYMSKWYEETPKIRKNLLMLMIRTIKSTNFNYRQFSTLDHQCLATVFQRIYSFFMFVIKFGMT